NFNQFVEAAARLHHENYPVARDFYDGGPAALKHITKHDREEDDHWALRRTRLAGVGLTGVVVDKIVTAEYGEAAARSFGENEALGDEFAAAIDTRRLHPSRVLTARQRAVDGCAVLNLYWDEASGRVRWKHELPEHVLPIVLDDWERLDAVIIDRRRNATAGGGTAVSTARGGGRIDEGGGARLLPAATDLTYEVEVYTPTESGRLQVNRKAGEAKFTGATVVARDDGADELRSYGCIPLVFFNGRRLVGDVLGKSLTRGVVELNRAANEAISTVGEVVRIQGFSLLVIQGALQNVPTDEHGRSRLSLGEASFVNIDAEGKVYFADPNPKIADALAYIAALVEWALATGRVPTAVVQPQQAHAESAASRSIQFLPLIDLINELETFDAESEFDFAAKALTIARRVGAGKAVDEQQVRDELADFKVDFSEDFYPVDDESKYQVYTMRRELALEGRTGQLRREHPDLDDDALAALAEEIDADEAKRAETSAFGGGGEPDDDEL
ncbi:MAG TPA: hypothetical protein VMW48_06160, partial [Vicinamibacterales bacterium]|nr:hypothetical protein [Vicinamibacterales bacterium]